MTKTDNMSLENKNYKKLLVYEVVFSYLNVYCWFFLPKFLLTNPRVLVQWLFCTNLMLLMMYALLIAEKDWWPQIAQCIHLFKHICTYTFIQKDPLPLEEASTASLLQIAEKNTEDFLHQIASLSCIKRPVHFFLV